MEQSILSWLFQLLSTWTSDRDFVDHLSVLLSGYVVVDMLLWIKCQNLTSKLFDIYKGTPWGISYGRNDECLDERSIPGEESDNIAGETRNVPTIRGNKSYRHITEARAFYNHLNRMVYFLIVSSLIYVINRDYNNYVSFWFAHFFPSEARTLGIYVPVSND
jgi:hypothetical protein